jgi:hypothetical protein
MLLGAGERAGPDFSVEARLIDGNYWEVKAGSAPQAADGAGDPYLGLPAGARDFDTLKTVVAPGIEADTAGFVVLPTGDLIVFGETDDDLSAFADAIEASLSPPYRARASRQEGDIFTVGARRIELAEFAYPYAERLQLSERDGVREFRVDDGTTDVAPPPDLVQLGRNAGADFYVTAVRIDGDYWEVMVNRF